MRIVERRVDKMAKESNSSEELSWRRVYSNPKDIFMDKKGYLEHEQHLFCSKTFRVQYNLIKVWYVRSDEFDTVLIVLFDPLSLSVTELSTVQPPWFQLDRCMTLSF